MRHTKGLPTLRAIRQENPSRPLPKIAVSALGQTKRDFDTVPFSDAGVSVGGVFKGGDYFWLGKGSVLIIASSKTNSILSIFDFNHVFRDLQFIVNTCYMCQDLVIIGLKSSDGKGCVGVYKPLISKLLAAIDIPYPVTALEVISTSGGATPSTKPLSKNLRYLYGIVAVGTIEGHCYLADLRLDGENGIGSLPWTIEILAPTSRNVPKIREIAISNNTHLAFELQASSHEEGVFYYMLPGEEILDSYYPCDASITTLLYEPRVTSLFVGFSFGQFQIFSLQSMRLIHASDFEDNVAPVLQFAFQEPENDPRKFCYLWVAKGDQKSAAADEMPSQPLTISMFQLGYAKKEIVATPSKNSGMQDNSNKQTVSYRDFEVCCQRFQHALGPGFVSDMSQCYGTTLLMCSSIEKLAQITETQECRDTEDVTCGLSPSSSFCVFGWKSSNDRGEAELHTLLFDINRWYMAQMPRNLCGDEEEHLYVSYWSFDLEDATVADHETILAMHVPGEKIYHFTSGKKPLPEKFFLPSACSFSLFYLTDFSLKYFSLFGHQQQVLNISSAHKSMCLANPQETYSDFLVSSLYSTHKRNQALTPDMMRENILTAALEHGQISFLLSVIKELASGHLAACGCTLRFVMDWAWKSVAHIKSAIDDLSVPIFDCSSSTLDTLLRCQLQFNTTQIYHLRIIFQKLMEYTEYATDQSQDELSTKLSVVALIYQYLKVLQWFLSNNLLPEQLENVDEDEAVITPNGILIYKYSRLRQVFNQRRNELKRRDCPDLLLIDGWIDEIGEPLISRWEKAENGQPNYPPPSFMALLDTYYLDCVDTVTKHCLVMYLLNDVVAMFTAMHNEEQDRDRSSMDSLRNHMESIMMFLQSFNVPTSMIKLTQGFWLLDHQHFSDALNIFLDSDTNHTQATWQERRILRAFLYQGHPAMALKYLSVCHPKAGTIEDLKMHITIYVENSEILKAWNLVQVSAGQCDVSELFSHLFSLSQQHSLLDQMLRLPLTAKEENMVINFLKQSEDPESTQILILLYLQQAKYVDAIKLHAQTKHVRLMRDQSEESRRRNSKLDHIVQAYSNLLPKIERELYFSNKSFLKQRYAQQKEVHKLSSLPAVLQPASSSEPTSKSGRIVSYIAKMEDLKRTTQEPLMTPLRRRPYPRAEQNLSPFPTADLAPRRNSINISGASHNRSDFGSPKLPSSRSKSRVHAIREGRLSSLSVASILLQTPPVVRKRPSLDQKEINQPIQTPQSILKVRPKLLKKERCPSPSSSPSPTSSHENNYSEKGDDLEETVDSEIAFNDFGEHVKSDIPVISTPHSKQVARPDPAISKPMEDENENNEKFAERVNIPAISTPSVKKLGLGSLKPEEISDDENEALKGIGTPRKIRFAGLDSSANDSDLSGIQFPVEQVAGLPNLTPVVVKAEDSDDRIIEVDVLENESITIKRDETADIVKADVLQTTDLDSQIPPVTIRPKQKTGEECVIQPIELSDVGEDEESFIAIQSDPDMEVSEEKISGHEDVDEIYQEDREDDEVICLSGSSGSNGEEEAELVQHGDDSSSDVENLAEPAQHSPNFFAEGHQESDDNLVLVLSPMEGSAEGDIEKFIIESTGSSLPNIDIQPGETIEFVTESKPEASEKIIHEAEIAPAIQDCSGDDEIITVLKTEDQNPSSSETHTEYFEEESEFAQNIIGEWEICQDPDVVDNKESQPEDQPHAVKAECGMEAEEKDGVELVVSELSNPVVDKVSEPLVRAHENIPVALDTNDFVTKNVFLPQYLESHDDATETDAQNTLPQGTTPGTNSGDESVGFSTPDVQDLENLPVLSDPESPSRPELDINENQNLELRISSTDEDEKQSETTECREDIQEVDSGEDKITCEVGVARVTEPEIVQETAETQNLQDDLLTSGVDEFKTANPPKTDELGGNEADIEMSSSDQTIKVEEKEEVPTQTISECTAQDAAQRPEVSLQRVTEEGKRVEGIPHEETNKEMQYEETTKNADEAVVTINPSASIVERVKTEPTFVLSPPNTRKGRRTNKSTQYTPSRGAKIESGVPKSPSRVTRSSVSTQMQGTPQPEPTFVFSKPSIRTRSSHKKEQQTAELHDESTHLPVEQSSAKRPRRKTKSSDQDSDNSSTASVRRPTRSTRSTTEQQNISSSESAEQPSTPSRKVRRSPGRKTPATPTRSSRRIKAMLDAIDESGSGDAQSDEPLPEVPTIGRRTRKTSSSSDMMSDIESEPQETPTRRSFRKTTPKAKSSRKDIMKIKELTPLPEEENDESQEKRRKTRQTSASSTPRVTRSSASYATRMRRKAKIHLPENQK